MQTEDCWMNNAKIYQVFIDRFAGLKDDYTDEEIRSGFLGGNLKALISRLDYIKGLNFDTIWLTPFNVNQPGGYHGYHIVNYMHVDPRYAFGTNPPDNDVGDNMDPNDGDVNTAADKVLIELIEEIHKRKMRIIADFVPNHCHETHPWFKAAKADVNSPYRNWFYFYKKKVPATSVLTKTDAKTNAKIDSKTDVKTDAKTQAKTQEVDEVEVEDYMKFLHIGELPKLNLDFKDCGDYIIKVAKRWLKLGVDSLRVDHVVGPSKEYLIRLNKEVKAEYPTCYLVGECLPLKVTKQAETILGLTKAALETFEEVSIKSLRAFDKIMLEYDGVIDGLLDFSFLYLIELYTEGTITEKECDDEILEHYKRFEKSSLILPKQVDSHDDDRILFKCHDNREQMFKILKKLYTNYEGRKDPLIIYYGTEDFMTHNKTIKDCEPYGDSRVRQPMRFGFEAMKQFFK